MFEFDSENPGTYEALFVTYVKYFLQFDHEKSAEIIRSVHIPVYQLLDQSKTDTIIEELENNDKVETALEREPFKIKVSSSFQLMS